MLKLWYIKVLVIGLTILGSNLNLWAEINGNIAYKAGVNVSSNAESNNLLKMNSSLAAKGVPLKTDSAKFLGLTEKRKKEIATHLFFRDGKLQSGEQALTQDALKALNILTNGDVISPGSNKNSLFQALNQTHTIAGSIVLSAILSNPIVDSSAIKKRQEVIRFLLENEKVFNRLIELMKAIKENEGALLSYWDERSDLDENIKDLFYNKSKTFSFLNKSPQYHQLRKIASGFILGLLGLTLPSIVIGMATYPLLSLGFLLVGNIETGLAFSAMNPMLALALFSIKSQFNYFRLIHRSLSSMHQRLRPISKIVQALEDLFYEINDNENLQRSLALIRNMNNFILEPREVSNSLYHLKDFLSRTTFDTEKFGIFSHAGNVIAAQAYMDEAKDAFIQPLEAIGELDACLSIVKIIKAHQTKSSRFCFVNFIEQNEPFLHLEEVWNVPLGVNRTKPATVTLGGTNNARHLVISGPICSGKSVIAQTLASSVLLARTFGIAPAKHATMTKFDAIYTCMDINGRANGTDILRYIKNNRDKKILAIIDEPYQSVFDESAELLTYDLLSQMTNYSNVISITATQYQKPTELALGNDQFANYHCAVNEELPNYFVKTFSLTPGRCEWWFNDLEKRNRYIRNFN